jgi:hypothetical protein
MKEGLVLLFLIFIANTATSQVRYKDKDYPANFIDEKGRKQGLWTITDSNNQLINEIEYRNNVPVKTIYFNFHNQKITLNTPDSAATPPNFDKNLFPFNQREIIKTILKKKCKYSISHLIDSSGKITELRLISGCSKKLDNDILDYFKTLEFEPAKLNGQPILSQWVYNYGISLK